MARILYTSILLIMGLPTFNELFIIWNFFMSFISNEIYPPYIMPHVVFQMHLVPPPMQLAKVRWVLEKQDH